MFDELHGTSWRLVGPFPIPEGVEPTADFAGNTVTGRTGCNRYHGQFEADGVSFRLVGPLATTMMLCPPPAMEVEQAMLAAFAAATGMRLGNGTLELLSGDDQVVLAFVEQGAVDLDGDWEVVAIHWTDRAAIISVDSPLDRPLRITFAEGTVAGDAGCNSFRGQYVAEGRSLTVGPLASTKKMCLDSAVMAQEQALLTALADTAGYRLEGSRLTLLRPDGGTSVDLTRP